MPRIPVGLAAAAAVVLSFALPVSASPAAAPVVLAGTSWSTIGTIKVRSGSRIQKGLTTLQAEFESATEFRLTDPVGFQLTGTWTASGRYDQKVAGVFDEATLVAIETALEEALEDSLPGAWQATVLASSFRAKANRAGDHLAAKVRLRILAEELVFGRSVRVTEVIRTRGER